VFTDAQKTQLTAPLNRGNVKSRKQGGRGVSYIEGWKAIEEANRIFGFDSWTRETTELRLVSERERAIGADKKPGWGVSYVAKVRVVVFATDTLVIREGVGAGHGIDVDCGQAHESAIKEAETDAMKRALMTFGNPFGLALYDKEQANVAEPEDESKARFKSETLSTINVFTDAAKLSAWWNSEQQKSARRLIGLDQSEANVLKDAVLARLEALKGKVAA
jgi:DNA repair and recombination protein RAD52